MQQSRGVGHCVTSNSAVMQKNREKIDEDDKVFTIRALKNA